ncbi:MAG: alpha-amylase family glycosyl hydrolase [Bacilli bacterium]|nr:alpha-amylase family glycosyl hydrolase [Bacilli bacterium]
MKFKYPKAALILALAAGSTTALGACGNAGGNANRPQYTISFYENGAVDKVADIKAYAGDKLTAPEEPIRAGYSFLGWYEDYHAKLSDYKTDSPFSWSTAMPEKNFTLYAGWAKKEGPHATEEEVDKYMESLAKNSEPGHLYYHYYRYDNGAVDKDGNTPYDVWDVWAFPNKPDAGEGARFDWHGRTTSSDRKSASGHATMEDIGGAYVDIDLNAHYKAGWDAEKQEFQDIDMTFASSTHIGLQIVKSATRFSDSGFWANDGGDLKIRLEDYAMELSDNRGKAYHIFVVQDKVNMPSSRPSTSIADPFDDDDGTNVTYGDSKYDNIEWNKDPGKAKTASDFLSTGVGYQIMVSSFADSDDDGFGDIYGIYEKLDYLEALGVKALWLTPIQLSDSYHGYDITDYKKVDPKFGSAASPAGLANNGVVTEETAMADYKLLVAEAKKRGMKIVMDLVLNHTSTGNVWFASSANLDEKYRGYYQWGNNESDKKNINEDKYWYPYGDHWYSYYAKFGSAMPELNYSFKSTREAVEDMSVFWTKDVGVDGFRLDAVKHIYMLDEISSYEGDTVVIDETKVGGRSISYSSDLTKNLHFFKELKAKVSADSGRDIFFVGENFDGHAYHVAPYYEAFDSMFDFYAYFNLTSAAKTGRKEDNQSFGSAKSWMYHGYSSDDQVPSDKRFHKGQVGPTKTGGRSGDQGGSDFNIADNSIWDFQHVYDTYKKYREVGGGSGSAVLPGAFTSNHDIARVINRIAGVGNAAEGITAQGNIENATDYASYEVSANLVKIAEVMLPGLTWVYYGDEIGMTGNFPAGKDDQSSYADLWYRQPMKWVQGGKKGDEYGTTDYYVTGSAQRVEQDDINKSTAVKGALAQMDDPNSDFSILAKFIGVKNSDSDLVTGDIKGGNWVYETDASNVLCFSRANDKYRVVVNFNKYAVPINNDHPFANYDVIASYNGASADALPGYSAMVLRKK